MSILLRARFLSVIASELLFICNASAAEPKRVLIVNSFGTTAPPFSSQSTTFKSALVAKMGEPVDLDEVSLDMARYDIDLEQAILEYLKKREAKFRSDLVVTIGGPAVGFVAKYRGELFQETPVLYAAADQRWVTSDMLKKNAAYVGHYFDITSVLEDMLQVAPATKNIEIIAGATPLERSWKEVFQKAAEPLSGRIKFTYYNDFSFEQMRNRISTLPPDSYIFFLLFLRDVDGVTYNSNEAFERLHQVARAPINSVFSEQLGTGIVGGRLLQSDVLGNVAADMAADILHGKPASSLPPKIVERTSPRYDWRELQRWKINEKLLPPGSTVLFREPTIWDRYRTWIVGGISICILQGLLITALLANLVKRHRAERSLMQVEKEARHHREQINRLTRVSLLGEMTASLAHELNQPLSAIVSNANAGKRLIETGKEHRDALHDILVDVIADGRRAHEIIQDVRNTIKKGDAIRERINLNELVTNLTHVLRPDAFACSCEMETSLAKDLPLIEGDPVQIQQVLVNLVSNAFDAMRGIPPSQRKVEISAIASNDGGVCLTVRDHGTGVAAEVHSRLFEQFFTTKEQGLGMGLAIVRSIVEAHGGQINAENVPDGGARFYFTLPGAAENHDVGNPGAILDGP